MSCLSHRPSDPVYYIEDCQISVGNIKLDELDCFFSLNFIHLPDIACKIQV